MRLVRRRGPRRLDPDGASDGGSGSVVSCRPSNIANQARGSEGERVLGGAGVNPERPSSPGAASYATMPATQRPRAAAASAASMMPGTSSTREASRTPTGSTRRKLGSWPVRSSKRASITRSGYPPSPRAGLPTRGPTPGTLEPCRPRVPSSSRCPEGSTRPSPRACSRSRDTRCSARTCRSCISMASSTGVAGRLPGRMLRRWRGSAGFPFEICDLTDEFDGRVIDDFFTEHQAGRTPNPCARCNGEIKFGAFLRRADELGIGLVATGHYVRGVRDDEGAWHLHRGADPAKDQTYMLHMLGQEQLARARFPVGALPKAATRLLAARYGLPVASKPDSQELCFAPSGDAGGFVRSEAPAMVRSGGEVVDPDGRVLAEHDGTFAFTVGQRRGLGVAADRPSTSWRWTRPPTAWWWGPATCSPSAACWPTACRGLPAGRPPTVPSRPRCGSGIEATMSPRWSRPARERRCGSSSARRSARWRRPERGRLPRDRDVRGRTDRVRVPLRPGCRGEEREA